MPLIAFSFYIHTMRPASQRDVPATAPCWSTLSQQWCSSSYSVRALVCAGRAEPPQGCAQGRRALCGSAGSAAPGAALRQAPHAS